MSHTLSPRAYWASFALVFLIAQSPAIGGIQQVGSGGDFVIAGQQTGSSSNTEAISDVTGGNAGALISYTETGGNAYSKSGGRTGDYGISNLNDGDIGLGNVPDGTYAKPDYGKGAVVMDFGGYRNVTSIAIYHGYAFAEQCSFELKDGLGNRIGRWQTLQAGGSITDAYWLVFDEPVLTDRLILDAVNFYTPNPGTPSFREIQVFSQTVAPPPSEVTVFGTEERTALSNAATGDTVKLERKSAFPSTPNYSPDPIDTYDVSLISSGEIIIEQGVAGGPYDYNDRNDITSMEIMARRVIIRSPLRLKGTDVKIHAHELRFEGAGKIITTPAEQPLRAEGPTSEDGLPAGSVTIHANTFLDLSGNNDPKFDLRGGKGQDAKKGAHGEPGTDLEYASNGTFTLTTWDDDVATYTPPPGMYVTRWRGGSDLDIWNGVNEWPGDGGDAVPPGQPGNGGNGGMLTSNLNAIHGVYEAGPSGAPGTPDETWIGVTEECVGGTNGWPDFAIHIFAWTSGILDQTAHISEEGRHTSKAGKSEPLKFGSAGAAGSKTTAGDDFSWLRPELLRQVLAGIKDDYLQNRITDAEAALAGYSSLIESYREHYTTVTWDGSQFVTVYNWPLGSEMTRFELNQIYDEMQILRQQITAGLDYFGNPNGWVPMLSFEFTKNLFDQEIDRSLDIIYLSRWISRKQDDASVMYAALGTASTRLKEEIDQAKTDFDAAEAELLNLTGEGQSIKTRIISLQQQLQLRDNELRQDAKENVAPSDWEVGLRAGLKVAGTICEMIPVYQPALGGVGGALNLGADFDPEQPWATVTGGLDITSSGYTAIAASATAQKANKNAVNTADLGADQRIARLQALGQASSALSNGIKGVSSVLDASKAPASEVEAELSKLRNSDPAYSALVDDIEKMLEDKRVWADKLNRAILKVATLSDTITRNILAVDAMDIASGQQGNLIDSRINAYMKDMERRAFDRLLKYHYYMAKAFEYRLVRPYSGNLDLQPLFDRIEQIALAGTPNGTLDANQQELLKSAYRDVIAQTTEDIVTQYNTSPSTPGGTRSYSLTPAQIATLNQGDVLKLNPYELPGLFQPGEENVRIVNLEVVRTLGLSTAPGMTTTPRSGGSYDSSSAYVELIMEHSGVSSIKLDGDVFQFRHYNESTRNAITWISQYEPNLNIISPTPPQEAADSLLRSLINNDSNAILYSRPSAWADLRIWRRGANGAEQFGPGNDNPPIVITGVTLRVTFDRVSRTTNPNVRDISVVSQATDGTPISPKFAVSQADRNGRQDGEGRFLRIYNFSGSNVQITAPAAFGSLGFVKWTRNGFDLTTNATASVPQNDDQRLVAVYSPLAPVISDSPPETVPYLENYAYKVRADFAPETYAASGLPPGLMIDANTGIIAGIASVIGTYTVNLTATNAQGADTSVLTLYVADLRQKITSTADSGPGSLRDLIASSTPGRVLVFDASLDGQTIDLSGSHLLISQDLTIDASALPNGVTISAGGNSRHFQVAGLKTLTLKNLTLTDGNATGDYEDGWGGSIYSVNGNVHLIETTISGCNGAIGGAIFSSNGTLTAIDSTFTGNSALLAAIYKSGGVMSITACTIDNNASDAFTLQEAGTYSFVRSTIAENTGKGIGAYSSKTVVVRNCTIANNGDDGIRDSSSDLKLENSIVAGNFGSNHAWAAYAAGINLFDYTTPTPDLSPLGDYGGKTRTMRPLEGSPAINGAQPTPDTPAADQRGFAAYQGLDIGAFQTQLGAPGPVDINQDLSTGELPLTVGAVGDLSGASSNPTLIPDGNIVLGGSGANRTVQVTPAPGEYGTATITITDDLTGGQASFAINVGSTLPVVHPLWPSSPDGSQRTLRDVVARVAEGSTITFEYFNNEDLTSPIVIDKNLTIDGDRGWRVSLASDGSSRLFEVAEGKTLTIKNMNLSGGVDSDNAGGGAILNRGTLILIDCEVTDCFTPGQGGAIHSLGDLTVIRSVISNNTATGSGGGIFHTGGKLSVINSTIANNTTSAQGGGIYSSEETDLIHNTISANSAAEIGGVRVGGQAAVYIENTIIAGNHISLSTPDLGSPQSSSIVSGGGNLIGNNQTVAAAFSPGSPNAGNDFVNVAAKLSPLTGKSSPGNNGYNTKQTMLLLPGSPAIENAIITAFSPSDDMLGMTRYSNPDIGAIEATTFRFGSLDDSDGDGIPDLFESVYPQMTEGVDDSLLDSDGDGWTDIAELRNMTDPLNGNDFLKILAVAPDEFFDPEAMQVTFSSFPGLLYKVEGSSDLTSWAEIPNLTLWGAGMTTTSRIQLPAGISFIRLKRQN